MGQAIKLIGYLCFLMALYSCKETKEQQISRLIHEWEGRTIVYPADMTFNVLGKDSAGYSFPQNEYTIMTYVDSVGCTSCKLQLPSMEIFHFYGRHNGKWKGIFSLCFPSEKQK